MFPTFKIRATLTPGRPTGPPLSRSGLDEHAYASRSPSSRSWTRRSGRSSDRDWFRRDWRCSSGRSSAGKRLELMFYAEKRAGASLEWGSWGSCWKTGSSEGWEWERRVELFRNPRILTFHSKRGRSSSW